MPAVQDDTETACGRTGESGKILFEFYGARTVHEDRAGENVGHSGALFRADHGCSECDGSGHAISIISRRPGSLPRR
jgi:hypothetical protein